MMQAGLIDKWGNIYKCEYYEIENLCIKITEKYCLESKANNKHFLEFAKDYTYFSPYFDFVVGVLWLFLNKSFITEQKYDFMWRRKQKRF